MYLLPSSSYTYAPNASEEVMDNVQKKLRRLGISDFIIFHPSAQYKYKIYPQHLRNKLLSLLGKLGITIIVTGTSNKIDREIKNTLPSVPNVIDLIGETSLEECLALSSLSKAYVGMDTLNMHIAAAQNNCIFAIFGPTNLTMWSPWSNELKESATENIPIQNYANITIFQADMPCVACGMAGCDNQHGKSICLDHINPKMVFDHVNNWYQNAKL